MQYASGIRLTDCGRSKGVPCETRKRKWEKEEEVWEWKTECVTGSQLWNGYLGKEPIFYRTLRFKKQELQMYTYVKQIYEWVGNGQINPRRCNHSCNDAVFKCWETLEPLPYYQGCASGENKEDGNFMLVLPLNCLLDKQGAVLCSARCVYFCKGTPCWGLRGPKMNGRHGCRLNLARLNAQQVVVWKYI